MYGLAIKCALLVIVLFGNISNGQEQEAVDELNSFFEAYSTWQKQKRETDGDADNATISLNWGYRRQDITYWASEEKVDFYSGFIKCKQLGMEPVSVMSLEQNNQLEKFLEPLIKADEDYAGFWIFAQKIGDKDKFYWLATGKPLGYTKWFVNYPDNWGGNENCLSILFSTTAGPGWNDVVCDKPIRYVCQKRKASVAFILDINRGLN